MWRRLILPEDLPSAGPKEGGRRFTLQWHITERCNLRCAHCYQDGFSGAELPFYALVQILGQFKDLLAALNKGVNTRGHITITGGEPFVREDFMALLEAMSKDRGRYSFSVLTNGTAIDPKTAARLRALGPSYVQVSVDGGQASHDRARGEGSFARAVSAVKCLVAEKITTLISFTATRGNYQEFPAVAGLGRRLGVRRVWADRFIPCGVGVALGESLTPVETDEFFGIMKREMLRAKRNPFARTEVAMHRALQFLHAGGRPYRCNAGDTLMAVQPNGDLYPCRRMPVKAGNVMETTLAALYSGSGLFKELREAGRTIEGCEKCLYSKLCGGGLRCLSYAVTGSPFKADPGCWIKSG